MNLESLQIWKKVINLKFFVNMKKLTNSKKVHAFLKNHGFENLFLYMINVCYFEEKNHESKKIMNFKNVRDFKKKRIWKTFANLKRDKKGKIKRPNRKPVKIEVKKYRNRPRNPLHERNVCVCGVEKIPTVCLLNCNVRSKRKRSLHVVRRRIWANTQGRTGVRFLPKLLRGFGLFQGLFRGFSTGGWPQSFSCEAGHGLQRTNVVIIKEIKQRALAFNSCSFVHEWRLSNVEAHCLAKHALIHRGVMCS